jgi:hypothetical protein
MASHYVSLFEERKADVFSELEKATAKRVAFAHCVSADAKMGLGVAKAFAEKFGENQRFLVTNSEDCKVGGVVRTNIRLGANAAVAYNLVTKHLYTDKPTYHSFGFSLDRMFDLLIEDKINELYMPRVGCGLDKLEWSNVRQMIVLRATKRKCQCKIIICSLK